MAQFYCQKCESPLKISDSLMLLNTVRANLLKNNSGRYFDTETNDGNSQASNTIKPNAYNNVDNDLTPEQFIAIDRLQLYELINTTQNAKSVKDDLGEYKDKHVFVSTSVTPNSLLMVDETDNNSSNEYDDNLINESNGNEDSMVNVSGLISTRLKTLSKVFDILSNNHNIDHPLCQDCSKLIIDNYKLKFDQTQKEKEYYTKFLKRIQHESEFIKQEEIEIDSKLTMSIQQYKKLQDVEQDKIEQLKQLEMTKLKLDEQLHDLKQELQTTKNDELMSILKLHNDMTLDLQRHLTKLDHVKGQYQTNLDRLDDLRKFNIYNEIFSISVDAANTYGTINNFRLGYKVPYNEINSGLGQIVLLLHFIIRRLNVTLPNYKLVPMGCQSHIIKYSRGSDASHTKAILNLYSSNDFSIGKLFNFNKLDVALIALLEVVSKLQATIESLDEELDLPYKISSKHDSIGGKSIRISSNSEWTESCKFLLTNLNWMFTYTSVHTHPAS